MSDPLQAYAFVGPQRIGKTVLAQHLTRHLAALGYQCVVVGIKAAPGEWGGCKRYIGRQAIPTALDSILAEMDKRIGLNQTSPTIAVFLDDWISTTALDEGLAEQFFVESATRMLTAGIVPYFLLQSDSKADWGTKHGAQLKNNFVHLLLTAPRDNGRLNHSKVRGAIIYPGDKTQYPVTLPTGLPLMGGDVSDFELAAPAPVEPNPQEADIIALAQTGASLNEIARATFGNSGGYQTGKIKEVLTKFNPV